MFLWYIYLLSILYLISPLFFRLSFRAQCLVLLGSVPLTFYLPTDFLAINQLFRYFFFYCGGVLCAQQLERLRNIANVWLILSFFLFATALAIKAADAEIPYIITGALSIPTCFGLSRLIRNQTVVKDVLESLSRHSFIIYLLQMFVVNACAICWNMLNLQKALPFSVFLLLSTCAAIIIPIYISVVYDKLQTKFKIVSR